MATKTKTIADLKCLEFVFRRNGVRGVKIFEIKGSNNKQRQACRDAAQKVIYEMMLQPEIEYSMNTNVWKDKKS